MKQVSSSLSKCLATATKSALCKPILLSLLVLGSVTAHADVCPKPDDILVQTFDRGPAPIRPVTYWSTKDGWFSRIDGIATPSEFKLTEVAIQAALNEDLGICTYTGRYTKVNLHKSAAEITPAVGSEWEASEDQEALLCSPLTNKCEFNVVNN